MTQQATSAALDTGGQNEELREGLLPWWRRMKRTERFVVGHSIYNDDYDWFYEWNAMTTVLDEVLDGLWQDEYERNESVATSAMGQQWIGYQP
jgi:hypothetical protein